VDIWGREEERWGGGEEGLSRRTGANSVFRMLKMVRETPETAPVDSVTM